MRTPWGHRGDTLETPWRQCGRHRGRHHGNTVGTPWRHPGDKLPEWGRQWLQGRRADCCLSVSVLPTTWGNPGKCHASTCSRSNAHDSDKDSPSHLRLLSDPKKQSSGVLVSIPAHNCQLPTAAEYPLATGRRTFVDHGKIRPYFTPCI